MFGSSARLLLPPFGDYTLPHPSMRACTPQQNRPLDLRDGSFASFANHSHVCFAPKATSDNRARNLVERFFNKIKHCRRVATRYDKLAANYLAFVQLASIRLWLRANESAS